MQRSEFRTPEPPNRPSRSSRRLGVLATVVGVTAVLAACGSDATSGAGAVSIADPNPVFADVPRLAETPAQSFVGAAAAGAGSIGINVGGPTGDTITAYWCDGEQKSEWFQGTLADDGTITAKSAAGDTLTATITGEAVTGTVGSTSFTLEPAEQNSGLYRETTEVNGETVVSGWIVGNDGTVVGAAATKTKVVAGTASDIDGDPTGAAPAAPTTNPNSGAEAQAAFRGLRCAALGFRAGRQMAIHNGILIGGGHDTEHAQNATDALNAMEELGC